MSVADKKQLRLQLSVFMERTKFIIFCVLSIVIFSVCHNFTISLYHFMIINIRDMFSIKKIYLLSNFINLGLR